MKALLNCEPPRSGPPRRSGGIPVPLLRQRASASLNEKNPEADDDDDGSLGFDG